MSDWKKICKKLLFLPVWLICVLAVVSTVALVAVFINDLSMHPIAYIVYVVSAYALTVLCIYLAGVLPGYYRTSKKKIYDHPLGNRYMTDAAFKVKVSLYCSLGVNVAYSVFKLVAGIVYSSFWWGAIAVYYIILSGIRFLLLRYMRGEEQDMTSELKSYRLCGILLVPLNLSLTGIVFQMVWQNKAYTYPEIIIIASATYTFYTVTLSIIEIIKYRKYKSPVMSASKAIRFAAALVSLLSLETAMLARYGEDDMFRRIMTAATGSGVCIAVLAISSYMIIRSCRELDKAKINNS